MNAIENRARELLPQILLTVLSIIQALALEVLWSSMLDSEHLWQGGFVAVTGWIQVFAVFLGILVMWLFNVSLVFRYSWAPRVSDSVIPFILGVLEFTMAEMLEPEFIHLWIFVLAALFGGASLTSVVILSRALVDDANREMREAYDYSPRQAALSAGIPVGVLILAGIAVQWAGPGGWVALCAVIGATGLLLFQTVTIRKFWNQSLEPNSNPSP